MKITELVVLLFSYFFVILVSMTTVLVDGRTRRSIVKVVKLPTPVCRAIQIH